MRPLNYFYTFITCCFMLMGCQSNIDKIGQEHAKEVIKWQELARYAGNELKYLGLTVSAGVQVEQGREETSYSIANVHLDRDINNTEIDLLSPEFAEKLACGTECQKISLYNANFATQETQLTHFFLAQEGKFFEFYGRLTLLNEKLAYYRKSSPDIFKQYIDWMLTQQLTFDSLSTFFDYLDIYIAEDKLLAFSKNGFISPVEDRLSTAFLADMIAALPQERQISDVTAPDSDWQLSQIIVTKNKIQPDELPLLKTEIRSSDSGASLEDKKIQLEELKKSEDNSKISNIKRPDFNWNTYKSKMPGDDWNTDDSRTTPNDDWDAEWVTPDMQMTTNALTSDAKQEKWQRAKKRTLQIGSIACTFSDNRFGVVKEIDTNMALLKVIGQTKEIIDGVSIPTEPGQVLTENVSFHLVKNSVLESYALTDIATCDIRRFKRVHRDNKNVLANE